MGKFYRGPLFAICHFSPTPDIPDTTLLRTLQNRFANPDCGHSFIGYLGIMLRFSLIGPCLLTLAACSDRTPLPHNSEAAEIITAVLARQPDVVAQRRRFLADHPEEASRLEGLTDIRLCVDQEAAGSDGDFSKKNMNSPGAAPNDHRILSDRWAISDRRFTIKDVVKLPKHLRWGNTFAFCPSGTLRLGNPVISANHARVFFANECAGWCGWGGEVTLRRKNGEWHVDQEIIWWQA